MCFDYLLNVFECIYMYYECNLNALSICFETHLSWFLFLCESLVFKQGIYICVEMPMSFLRWQLLICCRLQTSLPSKLAKPAQVQLKTNGNLLKITELWLFDGNDSWSDSPLETDEELLGLSRFSWFVKILGAATWPAAAQASWSPHSQSPLFWQNKNSWEETSLRE